MMLPLCTIVTLLRLLAMAYSIAERNRRSVPSCETGLMPMPDVSGKRILRVLLRERLLEELEELLVVRRAGFELDAGVDVFGVLAEDHHVDLVRRFTGEGTPLNQRTGRRQT